MATDVINSHMCEGLTITNSNIANVDVAVFAPDNTISSSAHHYSLTISHSTIDPIRSFGVSGYINSLRLVGNHFGVTSNAGVLCTLLAGSYSTVISGNRVVGGSYPTSTATAITLNTQGAAIVGNCMEGFNIIADLSNAPSSVVVGNVFTNTTSFSVVLTGANSTYSGNQEVNCASLPSLGNNALSGSYTPTLSNSSGITGTPTASTCNWYRVRGPQGDRIHVFGSLTIQPTTASGITNLQMSLPIASAFTVNTDLAGTGAMEGTSQCVASIRGIASTHNAFMQFIASADIASRPWYFEFSYAVK